ncbi:MAG: hypothetical protein H6700_07845 [Myxococcales bacterium]|nr:hypothetical protein [Myxococcales bacterium]MCB9521010.1 hypothetical protein [Myxococcales bacterium]MCB9531663.1 hypothetical protein [Myxococcales bacterium]
MRIVFLSYFKPIDRYVLQRVSQRWEPVGLVQVLPNAETSGRPAKPRANKPLMTKVMRVLQARWYDDYYRRMDDRLGRVLFPHGIAPLPIEPLRVPRGELHSDATLEAVRAMAPDVLIVSGAPILKPALFGIAPIALNIHLGLAPDYRGEHTLFWPLLNGDYDRIGATLHRLDAGVDTGPVLARVYPELEEDDTETTLVVKSLKMVATALVEFVLDTQRGRADQHSGGFPVVREGQFDTPPGGHNIRYADRSLAHDVALSARRLIGNRPTPRPARVERFY